MSNIEKSGWYSPCRECGFWVKVKDTYCPNCGIITPRWSIPPVTIQFSKNGMIVGGIAYFLLKTGLDLWKYSGAGWLGIFGGNLVKSVLIGALVGAAIGVGKFFLHTGKQQKLSKSLQRRSQSNLRKSELAINQRLDEMVTREKRIHDTLQEIRDAATPSQKILDTFQSSLSAIQIQRDRYIVKLWEIALIRWYNTLKPLTEDVTKLTYDMCDARVKKMSEVLSKGLEMLQSWQRKPTLTGTQQTCIERLQKALDTCQQVHQDLLSHKAALAVQGLSPLDDHVQSTPAVLKSLDDLDAFTVLPDLGEFTSGLKALDEEYFRLKGEEEVHREFEPDT